MLATQIWSWLTYTAYILDWAAGRLFLMDPIVCWNSSTNSTLLISSNTSRRKKVRNENRSVDWTNFLHPNWTFRCLFYNMLGLFAVVFLCSFTGLLIFAKYYDCDPVSAISPDGTTVYQLTYSKEDFHIRLIHIDRECLRSNSSIFCHGRFGKVSYITWHSTSWTHFRYIKVPIVVWKNLAQWQYFLFLSSVSSSLNALPAIIVEDYIKPFKPGLSSLKLGYLSKIISAVGGMLSFCLIFVIAAVGNILPVRVDKAIETFSINFSLIHQSLPVYFTALSLDRLLVCTRWVCSFHGQTIW